MIYAQLGLLTVGDIVNLTVIAQLEIFRVEFCHDFVIGQLPGGFLVDGDDIFLSGITVFFFVVITAVFGVKVLLREHFAQFIGSDRLLVLAVLFIGYDDIGQFEIVVDSLGIFVVLLLAGHGEKGSGRGGDLAAVHGDIGGAGDGLAIFTCDSLGALQRVAAVLVHSGGLGIHQLGDVFGRHFAADGIYLFKGQGLLAVLDGLDTGHLVAGIADVGVPLDVPVDLCTAQLVLQVDVFLLGLGLLFGVRFCVAGTGAGAGLGALGGGRVGDGGVAVFVNPGLALGLALAARLRYGGFCDGSVRVRGLGLSGVADLFRLFVLLFLGFAFAFGLTLILRLALVFVFLYDIALDRGGTGVRVFRFGRGIIVDIDILTESFLGLVGFLVDAVLFFLLSRSTRAAVFAALDRIILVGRCGLRRGAAFICVGDRLLNIAGFRSICNHRLRSNTGGECHRHGRKLEFFVRHVSELLSYCHKEVRPGKGAEMAGCR